ncbi:MAG: OmpH family outer membrane protein [Filimonas sp.]|nr:OmpH family outer membrane protein [Filimonas sp.]
MKNFLIAVNVALVLAVGILFYLHFADKKVIEALPKTTIADSAAPGNFKIAYFDVDTLENQYVLAQQVREFIRGKESQINAELTQMRKGLQEKAREYEKRGPSMSQAEQMAAQQEWGRLQQEYQNADQEKHQQLQGESIRRLQEVKMKIQDFLKAYSKTRGYIFVFASSDNDNFFYYKDSSRNITTDVVKQLNELYKAENKKK